jgi:uncharacterized protein (DUF488 family)
VHRTVRGLVVFDSRTGRVRLVQSLRVSLNVSRRGYATGTADGAEWLCALNALRVLAQVSAAEQIVGRERNYGACHRQLVRNVVTSRRVNSTVRRLIGQ